MPSAVPVACLQPRCPHYAVRRGYCLVHARSETQRGYGMAHAQHRARASLALTLPAPCFYCRHLVAPADDWVAAHLVDRDPTSSRVVAHRTCNERAKVR